MIACSGSVQSHWSRLPAIDIPDAQFRRGFGRNGDLTAAIEQRGIARQRRYDPSDEFRTLAVG